MWSPDGETVAFASDYQIYTYNTVLNTAPRRITFEGRNVAPVFSPDGTRLAFSSKGEGRDGADLLVKELNSDEPATSLLERDFANVRSSSALHPDGDRLILAVAGRPGVAGDGAAPRLVLVQNFFTELLQRMGNWMSDATTRLNAALEGRYRVERQLGEGGMATVHLARDEKHNRNVALKVLKPEPAAVVGAERFLAEIKTTANLQHPHILPLHDSGDADGFLFYVMPYVEGETLWGRLDRERLDESQPAAAPTAGASPAAGPGSASAPRWRPPGVPR